MHWCMHRVYRAFRHWLISMISCSTNLKALQKHTRRTCLCEEVLAGHLSGCDNEGCVEVGECLQVGSAVNHEHCGDHVCQLVHLHLACPKSVTMDLMACAMNRR